MSEVNLPPLPPTGGETPGRSIIDIVNKQHRELLTLTERLEAAPDDRKLTTVLVATASRHLCAEEQYLYPAVRTAVPGGNELAERELTEDQALMVLLGELERSGDRADLADAAEAIRRHVAADAEELLPLLEQMVPGEDLVRLGNRLETAEEAAPTRPHPATPSTPPWNKVVDPIVGVVDKVRDVVTARTTYVRDL
ncbi:hemerythrin domain-containing protein [Actinoplanes sp. DH11]|uniref:hemerythrin domain-containing protein n=1 Tax=Actinoplanes sp. DH11 TaxID=2857011 RepID=UPI0027DFEA2A|nr:hemerythrin domain-containing protein [Actinoplanes sp. DH11]